MQEGRQCNTCGIFKPLEDFEVTNTVGKKSWIHIKCRLCEANARKKKQLKFKYGITPEIWQEMFDEQDGKCAICLRQFEPNLEVRLRGGKKVQRVFVDHNHDTGKVRALLCGLCNSSIGMMGDNIENLYRAIEYLKKHDT